MADEQAMQAVSRIERALARIEAAAARGRPAPRDDGELLELRRMHQTLRGTVEDAIGQIDRLLAEREGE